MKSTLTPTAQTNFLPTRWKLVPAALVLLHAVGCASAPPLAETPGSVHVAFSGGGWRAHTAQAGWTMSLLNDGSRKLKDVFSHVGTVSSNSGGSWFSTMLMYSDSFDAAVEAKDAIQTWGSTGWLGKQQALFDAADCHLLSGGRFEGCVFNTYASATYWDSVVKDLVFKDYPIQVKLNGNRQPWAENKPLLLAATLLTTEVVLNEEDSGDKRYYEACLSPSTPVLNGSRGAVCSRETPPFPDVTPVTFSSMPSGSRLRVPPFLSAAGAGTNLPMFNMGYTENAWFFPEKETTTIQNPLANDDVLVVIAAAASSAAGGFEASAVVSGDWQLSYEASDEALSFQLKDSDVRFVDASHMSVRTLADLKVVRIADGGPVDNSGVAQLVSFLQLNHQADGFNIVAFDNVQELYSPGGNAVNVGIDIAYLFGKGLSQGNKFCSGVNGSGTCINVPDLQIFDPTPLMNRPVLTWSVAAGDDSSPPSVVHELIYTKYTVTTINNTTFGVTAGTTGTLHVFTCAWSDADTSPQNKTQDGDFKAYAQMLRFINAGLRSGNAAGLKYLEDALGLNQ